jgi:hypothetical protein
MSSAFRYRRGTQARKRKAGIPTIVRALPEHLLEDLEPCRVVIDDEDAQPVGEGGGGQGHGAAPACELWLPALSQGREWGAGDGVGEQGRPGEALKGG